MTLRYCHHVDFSVFRSFNSFKREIGLKYQKGVGSLTEYPAALDQEQLHHICYDLLQHHF